MSFLPGMAGVAGTVRTPADVSFTDNDATNANLTTYEFADLAIGAAKADRYVYAAVTSISSGTTVRTVSSATIGGVSAEVLVEHGQTASDALGIHIIRALVPTGTTATVSVTFSGSCGAADIGVWRVTDHRSTVVFDTAVANNTNGDPSDTINVPSGGFVIAGSVHTSASTVTWTGATEDYDADNPDGGAGRASGAHSDRLPPETGRAIGVVGGISAAAMCAVSLA